MDRYRGGVGGVGGVGGGGGGGALGALTTPLNYLNTAADTVTRLDQFQCVPRLMCEFTARRRLFNGTSALLSGLTGGGNSSRPPSQAVQTALDSMNLQNPQTFNSFLGSVAVAVSFSFSSSILIL